MYSNEHPAIIRCGFCGTEIVWGYDTCCGCRATVVYGAEARGFWRFVVIVGVYALLIAGFCVSGLTMMWIIDSIEHSHLEIFDFFEFRHYPTFWGLVVFAGFFGGWFGFAFAVGKFCEWIAKKTNLDRFWRNNYQFYQVYYS